MHRGCARGTHGFPIRPKNFVNIYQLIDRGSTIFVSSHFNSAVELRDKLSEATGAQSQPSSSPLVNVKYSCRDESTHHGQYYSKHEFGNRRSRIRRARRGESGWMLRPLAFERRRLNVAIALDRAVSRRGFQIVVHARPFIDPCAFASCRAVGLADVGVVSIASALLLHRRS